jgi:hypothetical protein
VNSDNPNSAGSAPAQHPINSRAEQSAEPTAAAQSTSSQSQNRRPENVISLLHAGEVQSGWYGANKRQNRFYVLNIREVLSALDLDHTLTRPYFQEAQRIIAEQTSWKAQYPFEYVSSHTQIYPRRRDEPKLFGHAATIIVAMEVAAREKQPTYNVYDQLRILSANYFVDRFDENKLRELTHYHSTLSSDAKREQFGESVATSTFEQTCLVKILQEWSENLLTQMVSGFCVTKYTAEKLIDFVNSNYPSHLHVGPARASGEDAASQTLGHKNAAPALRVPKTIPVSEFAPCY